MKYTELDFLTESRIPPTYSCPTGYVLIDRYCELVPNMSCPPSYTLNNGICMKTGSFQSSPVPVPEMVSPVPVPEMVSPVPMIPEMVSPVPVPPCPSGFERRGSDKTCYPIA